MILSSLLFFIACFVILLIIIPVGVKLLEFSEVVSSILMLILGALTPYLLAILLQNTTDSFEYRWYHFIGLIFLVGSMNNGNLRGEATKAAEMASTFLFGGVVIMSIIMFWIT